MLRILVICFALLFGVCGTAYAHYLGHNAAGVNNTVVVTRDSDTLNGSAYNYMPLVADAIDDWNQVRRDTGNTNFPRMTLSANTTLSPTLKEYGYAADDGLYGFYSYNPSDLDTIALNKRNLNPASNKQKVKTTDHENGHADGLAHPTETNNDFCPRSVMTPSALCYRSDGTALDYVARPQNAPHDINDVANYVIPDLEPVTQTVYADFGNKEAPVTKYVNIGNGGYRILEYVPPIPFQ